MTIDECIQMMDGQSHFGKVNYSILVHVIKCLCNTIGLQVHRNSRSKMDRFEKDIVFVVSVPKWSQAQLQFISLIVCTNRNTHSCW
jgi:hypothetical protein